MKPSSDEIDENDNVGSSALDDHNPPAQHSMTHHQQSTSTQNSMSQHHHTSQYPSFVANVANTHNPSPRTSTTSITLSNEEVTNEENNDDDHLHTAATSPTIVKPTPITMLPRKRHIIGESALPLYSKDFSSSTSRKTPRLDSDETYLSTMTTTMKNAESSFLDSDDIFGQHVAMSMRGMGDQHTKEYFKLKVQELIYQVQFGERL